MFMAHPASLYKAVFIERPNRFIIYAKKEDGEIVTAHLPDPGRLKELLTPERKIWLRYVGHPKRKTKWSAVLCEREDECGFASLDTTLPNRLIAQALKERRIKSLKESTFVKAEYALGNERWDFLLEHGNQRLLLEVKSVTLASDGVAYFPDAVTVRGKKHVQTLTSLQKERIYDTAVLFVVQRGDVSKVRPAEHIDPAFSSALQEADRHGVRLLAVTTEVFLEGVQLGEEVPVVVHR
ncbi:sugar fermentation stimulation protein A [Geomicrobium halophilum]|uniref:Sugar fermentation stimulation protein homolog n=1 Tax=Geomicrobium halophilum TaxID=549000 RepID=A0A841Q0I6_9BACL|nr:DNA/RNA nuclease SfsA [Geomicrobium halophilum]MBB6450765.1 sugar fermentation stimulation protein A [Geomicrobium halophilum]